MPDDSDSSGPFEMVDITAPDGTPNDGTRSIQPLEVDEKDMPIEEARCWMINGTERPVDIFVNYADVPLISDVKPMEIGDVLVLDGTVDMPYGTYTFEARPKDYYDGPVLASASVTIDEGDSYSAVLHRTDTFDYQMSIYRNDYSNTEDARVVVRHNALPETIEWRFFENEETPRIPDDPRSGTLQQGQWQEARDVTEQDYVFEVLVDGQVAAFHENLEFEVETHYVVYVVGDPEPLYLPDDPPYEESRDGGLDEGQWLLVQAFEVFPGDDEPDVVTSPTEPLSATDDNQPIEFDCDPFTLYETNVVEQQVAATDPDGLVTGLAVESVDPVSDGFSIVDDSVHRAFAVGGTTVGTLRVASDVSPDTYEVTIVANPESLGAKARCTITVEVEKITIDRLRDLVERYHASGDIDEPFAGELLSKLDAAEVHLEEYEIFEACTALKEFIDVLGANKDKGIDETAHDDLQMETDRLRERLDCG